MILRSKNFHLQELDIYDVSDDYLDWVNDPELTQFLEIKYQKFTKDSLKKFITDCRSSENKTLWGIYCNNTKKHVGNISITCNLNRGIFDGGYFIGDKDYWGTSAAFEALTLMMKFGFEVKHMRRIIAGAYSNNMNARFLFHKIGFIKEARIKDSYMHKNVPVDVVIYSMGQNRWEELKSQFDL